MVEYLSILQIYSWPIAAAIFSALTLARLGLVLAARDRTVQTLIVSQSASFGALIGVAMLISFEVATDWQFIPVLVAAFFSVIAYFQSERLVSNHPASRSTFFIFIYVAYLSCGYFVAALIPALEGHMSRLIFGDLATLSDGQAQVIIVASFVTLTFLWRHQNTIDRLSFEGLLWQCPPRVAKDRRIDLQFQILALVYICVCTQALSFLFTIALLFAPSVLALMASRLNLKRHRHITSILSVTATALGIFASLALPTLPTVATIAVTLLILGSFASWL